MPIWKRNIFVRVIKVRMVNEGRTAEKILQEYTALTEADKAEILSEI